MYYLKKEKKRLCVCGSAAIRCYSCTQNEQCTLWHCTALLHRWKSRPGVPPLPYPYWPIHFSTGHTITPTILPSLWGPVTREPYIQTNSLSHCRHGETRLLARPGPGTRHDPLYFYSVSLKHLLPTLFFVFFFFYLIGIAQESFFFPKKAWCLLHTRSCIPLLASMPP